MATSPASTPPIATQSSTGRPKGGADRIATA